MRKYNQDKTSGVYFVARDFARGFDFKLAKDAYVMIVSQKEGIALSEIKQMIGRGSRAFGQATGAYYTYEFGAHQIDFENALDKKEKATFEHTTLLGLLYDKFNHQVEKDKALIREAFENDGWRSTILDFE